MKIENAYYVTLRKLVMNFTIPLYALFQPQRQTFIEGHYLTDPDNLYVF